MINVAHNVWLLPYELRILGVNIGRNVTVIRLNSGRLVIHSTARFSEEDVSAIRLLGEPGWLVEGMIDHDTFSREGREAFPDIPFIAPASFQARVDFEVESIDSPPAEWIPEMEVIQIEGAPKMAEAVFFHRPTGTLVVCDLLFHFPDPPSMWAKTLLTLALGFHHAPGFSNRLKMAINDKDAFRASLMKIMSLPIERIVPGHGKVLENKARERAGKTFSNRGYLEEI